MTTLGFKSRPPPGQGHERMSHEVKFGVKVAPQVKLSFTPGRPPTLDPAPNPAPAPAKSQAHRCSWPGQVWSQLTSMFTVQPTVNWVNPQLVRECHPLPPVAQYPTQAQPQYIPPPAVTHRGAGLWHPAPPGNQQQQMMMDPLLMLQGRDTGGAYLNAKMGTSGYHPATKMGMGRVYSSAKSGTSGGFPGAKLGMNGYYPSTTVYPSAKTDAGSIYPGAEMGTNGYYPTTEMDTECVYPSFEMGTHGYVVVPKDIPETYPTTTTSSKPLNPYAQEWVPPGYCITTPSTPVVMKAPPHHQNHQDSTPIIPYSLQDFQNDHIEDTHSATLDTKALDSLDMTQVDPISATSPWESPGQSTESQSPLGYHDNQKERGSEESPKFSPEVQEIAEEGERGGELASPQSTASPGQEMCIEVPASSDCIKMAKSDLTKSSSSSNTRSQSPEGVQVCIEVPESPDCFKIAKPDLTKSISSSNSSSQSPERVQVCIGLSASPDCVKVAKSDLIKSGSSSNTSLQNPERVQVCVRLPSEVTQSAKPEPADAQQGFKSATGSSITKRVPDCASDVLVSATSPQSASQNQRVLDSEKKASSSADGSQSAAVSYARVVERATPSPPPPPQSMEDDKYKGVEQPIPKIFQRDRTPPRVVAAPVVGTCRMPELFRRPTKDQRTRSRKFLKELKELGGGSGGDGGVGGGVDWCFSSLSSSSSSSPSLSSSSSSSSSSLSELPHVSNSSHIPSSSSSQPRSPPSSSFPSSSPVPISPLHHPRPPRSASPMTPNSPGRERSESESSAASLDIDFADDVDCAFVAPVSAIPSASAKKPINRFLACILGSGESDSEEEEEEDEEEDWDEVCVANSAEVSANGVPDLDDSWETFGLEMIVLQCRRDPPKECQGEPSPEVPESECQTESASLKEINARWEHEVSKGVPAKSATRVRFGGTTVHPMVVWSHAYRKARCGPWEQQARDRVRFRQRIGTVEMALAPILEASHRTAVYERLHGTPTTTTTTKGS